MEITFNNKTIDINERIFWDLNKSSIDPDKHKAIIIERVLTRGTLEEFWMLVHVYGEDVIIEQCKNMPNLDALSLNFIAKTFNVDKKKFKCYNKTRSTLLPWS